MAETVKNRKYYSWLELIFGNGAIALWIILGGLACAIFIPLTAILFIGVAAFLVFYELGKKGCVTCYYCQNCTVGMGKLPYLFFVKGGTANVNQKALKMFPYIYLLLSVLPIVLVAFSLVESVTFLKVSLLALIIVFSVYTAVIRRKTLLGKTEKKN